MWYKGIKTIWNFYNTLNFRIQKKKTKSIIFLEINLNFSLLLKKDNLLVTGIFVVNIFVPKIHKKVFWI